jgi:phage tail-like protein
MKAVLSNTYVQSQYTGLDMYRAKRKIFHDFPDLDQNQLDIRYVESAYPRFTIIKSEYNKTRNSIQLQVASGNPIRHLSSQYQNNDFLHGFLMIFQHIMNDTLITLDNMYDYFRPMESPVSFLPVLADWLGIQLDTLGGETEVRRFLQYAIPLYRYRGTVRGLRAHLALVSGITPEIIEGKNPYKAFIIHEHSVIGANLFEAGKQNSFTIYFPVPRNHFDDTLIRRLSLIIQREKPVYTKAYISFREGKKARRVITTIDVSTVINAEEGISI